MTVETRFAQIQRYIEKIPSLSTTVTKVLEICNNPCASANDLNRLISYDPVLTGQLLKLINSAYYGLPNRITSLTRAIIMLGINTVKNLVLATSILAGCKSVSGCRQMSINDFWMHSLCVGVLSKLAAAQCRVSGNEKEEYFVAGLLHDVGKLPIMACFPKQYSSILEVAINQQISLLEVENANIGFNHCQVGVLIASKWKLNSAVLNAIRNHHLPITSESHLVNCVNIANQLTNLIQLKTDINKSELQTLLLAYAKKLEASVDSILNLILQMDDEVEKAKIFLQIVA